MPYSSFNIAIIMLYMLKLSFEYEKRTMVICDSEHYGGT